MFSGTLETQYAASLEASSLAASVACNAGFATLWCTMGCIDALRLIAALREHVSG